jgi:hypothetical protein
MIFQRQIAAALALFLAAAFAPLSAWALPDYDEESEEALVLYWANKHALRFVALDLDSLEVVPEQSFVLPSRDSIWKMRVRATKADKARVRELLEENWEGRKKVDYGTIRVTPGHYALVSGEYWFNPQPGNLMSWNSLENASCFRNRAPVFEFKAGTINTVENWAHLKERAHELTIAESVRTQKNNELTEIVLKGYPELAADVKTTRIVQFVKFEPKPDSNAPCSILPRFELIAESATDETREGENANPASTASESDKLNE